MVKTDKSISTEQVVESIKQMYPGNNVMLTQDLPALYSQGLLPVEAFLNVVIGLSVVISTLVILLAMYTTIIERTREIGILKSLGASKGFILTAIEKEAVFISIMGVLLGFAISLAGKHWIESATRLKIDLQPKWLIIAALIGIIGGLVGALYPAARAANVDPIEALSYE
jgi:putative ABC transport system permease protein